LLFIDVKKPIYQKVSLSYICHKQGGGRICKSKRMFVERESERERETETERESEKERQRERDRHRETQNTIFTTHY
jgi:hypothetical protein